MIAALVSVSEEVRSRCHLKHRAANYTISESPSSDSLIAELNAQGTSASAPASVLSVSIPSSQGPLLPGSTPLARRQKSCDLLDQTAMAMARMQKNTQLSQSQVPLQKNTQLSQSQVPLQKYTQLSQSQVP